MTAKVPTSTMDAIGAFDGGVDARLMVDEHLPPIAAEFLSASDEARRLFEDSGALAERLAAMVAASMDEIKRRLAFRRATDFAKASPLAWAMYLTAHRAAVDKHFQGVVAEVFGAVWAERLRAPKPTGKA